MKIYLQLIALFVHLLDQGLELSVVIIFACDYGAEFGHFAAGFGLNLFHSSPQGLLLKI